MVVRRQKVFQKIKRVALSLAVLHAVFLIQSSFSSRAAFSDAEEVTGTGVKTTVTDNRKLSENLL